MNLLFLYFSGTGNTDYVAHYLARKLEPLSLEIELRSIEWQPAEDVAGFDLLALGFPVYAGDSPAFLHDYLGRLPPGEGRGAFVFCTKGAYAAGAVRLNLQRLAARGYVPLESGSVMMPGTDALAMVSSGSWMARKAVEKDYDHLKDADRLAEAVGLRAFGFARWAAGRGTAAAPILSPGPCAVRSPVGSGLQVERELDSCQVPRQRTVRRLWPLRSNLPGGQYRDARRPPPLFRSLRALPALSPCLPQRVDPDRQTHGGQVSLGRAQRGRLNRSRCDRKVVEGGRGAA